MNAITKFPWFSILFLVIMIADLAGILAYPQVRLVSKGMIMASLLGLYILRANRQEHSFLLGIIFALLGDAFLLFTTDDFFLIGLGCFLVMQLSYAATFWKKRRIPRTKDKVVSAVFLLIPMVFCLLAWQPIADMRVAVVVYAIAITIMLVTAYLRHPRLSGYWHVLVGSILFVISDLLLAVDKFISAMPQGGVAVMVTYMVAQYLIVTGVLLDDQPKTKQQSAEPAGTFSRHKR